MEQCSELLVVMGMCGIQQRGDLHGSAEFAASENDRPQKKL